MDNKTMPDYTLYCTEEQTKKALELGAPIYYHKNAYVGNSTPHFYIGEYGNHENGWILYLIPTAEQMIGWLEDNIRGVITISKNWHQGCMKFDWVIFDDFETIIEGSIVFYNSRKEATISAIDAALEYLFVNKKII